MNKPRYRGITRNVRNEYLVTPIGSPLVVYFTGADAQLELMRRYLEQHQATNVHYQQEAATDRRILYASIDPDSYGRLVRRRSYELGLRIHKRRKDARGLQRGRRNAYQNDS